MASKTKFDITPEEQAGLLRFWRQQYSHKPQPVRGISLEGKTAIVTGANTGVGFETCRQLLDLGLSRLVIAVRNEEKGRAAAHKLWLGRSLELDAIQVWALDLSAYESVVAFAERAERLERLDLVNLNAGIAPAARVFNEHTGHDEVVQVNYLSTALLAILLMPVARAKRANQPEPTRITFTAFEGSAWTKFKERTKTPLLAALDKKGKVDMFDRMQVSKLLELFFVKKLAEVVPPSVAVINAASPGAINDSEFNREWDKTFTGTIVKMFLRRVGGTSADGGCLMADAMVKHGDETHGNFLSFQKLVPMSPIIYTPEGQKISDQLWAETMAEFAFANVEEIFKTVSQE